MMSNEIPTDSFDDIIFWVFDEEEKSNSESANFCEIPNLMMNRSNNFPQISLPNQTLLHAQEDRPTRFHPISWNSLPNISSQRNHRLPSLGGSQIPVQHPPCLPNIGSPPRNLPKRSNPCIIGSNSSLQFQPSFSSSFESDSPPMNYSGSGSPPNRTFQGEGSPDRQRYHSPPPRISNDVSSSPLMSSGNSSRSPSPSIDTPPCQQPSHSSPCFPTCNSPCNRHFCSSYDKELAEIRAQEEELCKLEEEKRKEALELNRQVLEVKKRELQIKKKELEIIKRRDDERRKEELRRLECLKKEETKKLEREFEYRQKCLREEHELELELLRRKEEEMNVFETTRYKDPSPEPCEIIKIDKTLESIEAEFKDCNNLYPENEGVCRMRESHIDTIANLDPAHKDRFFGETQQEPVLRSPTPKKKLFPALKKKVPLPVEKVTSVESPVQRSKKIKSPVEKNSKIESSVEKSTKVESPVEKFTKVFRPPCAKGKIIIKHEATVCNGGDCCIYSGPSCTLIPNSPIIIRDKKTGYNKVGESLSNASSCKNELIRTSEVSPHIASDGGYDSTVCEKLCSQCQQDIYRETDNHCCLEERRLYNDQEHKCIKIFKRRKEAKKDKSVAGSSFNTSSRRFKKSSSNSGSSSRKLKLGFTNKRKKNYRKYILNDKKRYLIENKKPSVNVPVVSIFNSSNLGQKKRSSPITEYEIRNMTFSPDHQSLPSRILKESYIDESLDLDLNSNIPWKKPYINLEDSFELLKISQLHDSTTDLNDNRSINEDNYKSYIPYLKASDTDLAMERGTSKYVFVPNAENSDESTISVIDEEIDWSDLEFQENDVSSCNSNIFIIHSDRSNNNLTSRSCEESLINFGSLSSDINLLQHESTQEKQLPKTESKDIPKDMQILVHNYLNDMDDHIIPLEERLKRVQRPFEETSSDESNTSHSSTSSEKNREKKSFKKRKSFFKRHFDFF